MILIMIAIVIVTILLMFILCILPLISFLHLMIGKQGQLPSLHL